MKFNHLFKRPVGASALSVLAAAKSRVLTGVVDAPDVVAFLIDIGQTPATVENAARAFTEVMRYNPSAAELDSVMEELASVGLAA